MLMREDRRLLDLIKRHNDMEGPKETTKLNEIPYMEIIPQVSFDYACPWCHAMMGEKNYSFKYIPEMGAYIHDCCNKPFKMPRMDKVGGGHSYQLNESYGIETTKSGFEEEGVGEVSKEDREKVDAIMNNKNMPEEAESGKAYIIHWADGRGKFACKYKSYLPKWLKEQGQWAEIVSIKYDDPDKLKVIKDK